MKFKEYFVSDFLTTRKLDVLPDRVKVRLLDRERANEVLVRAIQLCIVLMFTILYGLAAKTGQQTDFQPVPVVLAAYVMLSTIGLIWSIRSRLPDWAVYFSIFVDFGLLYSLMVSFHFQYEQPASFILKSPTLLYVFIFISLRALRLEWKFVAAAGIVAAMGWALVVTYVTTFDPHSTMITRSYVEYLTSNAVLIGAEIDKVISILAVTGILTLVVNASSNLLITAVTEQTAANDFSRFFDKRVAQDIRGRSEAFQAGQGQRRTMVIISIDIRGFSAFAARREASDVMKMLSEYQARIVPILQKRGAIIDKFMGDGIMATIGSDDSAEIPVNRRAIEAAEAVLLDNAGWSTQLLLGTDGAPMRIGIGIAGGPVTFGAVGQGDRLEMTVIGEPVNTAAKLEKHNKTLQTRCIVSRNVWEQAVIEGYHGDFRPVFVETRVEGIDEIQSIAVLEISH